MQRCSFSRTALVAVKNESDLDTLVSIFQIQFIQNNQFVLVLQIT